MLTSLEVCAGAGGQALGLEQAGFKHLALVEIDPHACATLRNNRPGWNVVECDLWDFNARIYQGEIDLLSGGVPCPPFSKAGKQLGEKDERDLFPVMVRLIEECKPRAVMIENVSGLLDSRFDYYRKSIEKKIHNLGYCVIGWKLLSASDFGVPQLRPRVVFVALKQEYASYFDWPTPTPHKAVTVGEALQSEMASNGWEKAEEWSKMANKIAPTLVGGSKKHGGPDLGPTRAKKAWHELGVDGRGLANFPPQRGFDGLPRLTVRMAAVIQGFPPQWEFYGKKTAAYRQVGNAFPPPVAKAVGLSIANALNKEEYFGHIERGAMQVEFSF